MAANVEVVITGRDEASGPIGGISDALGGLGTVALGVAAVGLAALGAALVGIGTGLVSSVKAAMEGQVAVAELEQVIKSTGGAAGLTSQELQDMATGLSQVTAFSDEMIMGGQAMLLTFKNIGEETFPRATAAMLDMGQMFGSVDAASVQLGKALNDPIAGISALSRIGVTFSEEQKTMIQGFMDTNNIAAAQNVILTELESQVGGLAEAYGKTFAGQLEIVKNRFGEIQETIGNSILPILETLMGKFIEWIPFFEEFGLKIAGVFTALGENGLGSFELRNAFADIDQFVGEFFNHIALAIELWNTGGGPEELTSKAMKWIENIGKNDADQPMFLTAAKNIFSAISGALGGVGWGNIAAAMDVALALKLTEHEWKASGDAFGDAIADVLGGTTAGFGSDSATTAALGKGIVDWFLAAMGVADWTEAKDVFLGILKQFFIDFGENLGDFWNNLEVSGTNAVRDAFDGIEVAITDAVRGWFDNIELDATTWIRTKIIDPIKEFLGIASPSTVFMEIGKNIIQGLWDGMKNMWGSFVDWISDSIGAILAVLTPQKLLEIATTDLTLAQALASAYSATSSTGSIGGSVGGFGGTTTTSTGGTSTGGTGAQVVQYFQGANIYVGSWDEIAYDCIYPHPFVGATGGQLGTTGGGGAGSPR